MLPQEIIRQKRDGHSLTDEEIKFFIKAIPSQGVSEGQVAAFCMAVWLKGMTMRERIALTSAMAQSGTVMSWKLDGPVLDKHSTGGIGDKVSLMLAPLIAACGGFVPMLSGRGLGHTGGTLDKMDSIKGYVSQPDNALFQKVVREVGCAIIGATPDLAPADRIMYGIRDVTATVESIDLITASILSKKLAGGLDGLAMDVKYGTGAFMQTYDDAKALAESIVSVANGAGMKTTALLTDMNEVLGKTAGNALEVLEAVAFLKNEKVDKRLYDVTMALCAEMLILGGLASSDDDAKQKLKEVHENGRALEVFGKMITALGGAHDFCERPDAFVPKADRIVPIYAESEGYLTQMDARAIGLLIVELGGGRIKPSDKINHAVGLSDIISIGQQVTSKTPLAQLHVMVGQDEAYFKALFLKAIRLSPTPPTERPLIKEKVIYDAKK
jgi:thymidine phosphorylase